MLNFSGRHYPPEIILQCVRWYVSYGISYRNLEEMMSERGIEMDHATLNRWVLKYAPEIEKKSRRYKRSVHGSWRMDETYIKVKGVWKYLYRAVDKFGKTVDFLLTAKRDKAAALRFFRKALKGHEHPHRVVIDGSAANKAALYQLNEPDNSDSKTPVDILQVKYLNNIVEQDHRHIKRITNPMAGFKKFHTAARTIAGIELMNMIRKKQFTIPNQNSLTSAQQFYYIATV